MAHFFIYCKSLVLIRNRKANRDDITMPDKILAFYSYIAMSVHTFISIYNYIYLYIYNIYICIISVIFAHLQVEKGNSYSLKRDDEITV